jgi:hypothetical protein
MEESFSPRQNGAKPKKKDGKTKRHRSMQNKVNHDLTIGESPKKLRKSFYHETTVKVEEEGDLPTKKE